MASVFFIVRTISFLRAQQVFYQLWYRKRRIVQKIFRYRYKLSVPAEGSPLFFTSWIDKNNSVSGNTIQFLNVSESFDPGNIQWNNPANGKLWAYNLNYMDYLLQPGMNATYGYRLINVFVDNMANNRTGLEPYPIALRGINWIKFLSIESDSTNKNSKERIDASLYAQYRILSRNIEYHLLGNHLLEDGFSLLFGAFYFRDEGLYYKAERIVRRELEEQILSDGGHFELSTMYHQILLDRLLDCVNLIENNNRFENQDTLLSFMKVKSVKMLQWINGMTFSNGEIPLVNDSAIGIAPTTKQLNEYALRLGIAPEKNNKQYVFAASGYRFRSGNNYECIVDVGQIGPSYQPGHAHADTFSFCLNVGNKPILVDPGISTYNAGDIRMNERSTAYHNTVTVRCADSSEVWSSFRVARRANVNIIEDTPARILAEHNGYKKFRTKHYRSWDFFDNKIELSDQLTGKETKGISNLWFAAEAKAEIRNDKILLDDTTEISFVGDAGIKLIPEQIPDGYNRYKSCYRAEISFDENLKTIISVGSNI